MAWPSSVSVKLAGVVGEAQVGEGVQAAPEVLVAALAVEGERVGEQADARQLGEVAVADLAQIHGPDHAVLEHLQQLGQVVRQAQGAGEVVERALRENAQGGARVREFLHGQADRAVAARDGDPLRPLRRQLFQLPPQVIGGLGVDDVHVHAGLVGHAQELLLGGRDVHRAGFRVHQQGDGVTHGVGSLSLGGLKAVGSARQAQSQGRPTQKPARTSEA